MVMASIFTAPKFLSMPAAGLDLSRGVLRFMELENEKGCLRVSRFGARELPLGVMVDGHVRDKKKLQEAIAGLAEEYHFSFANISLPEEQAYIVNMRLPRISPKEIHDAIELELEEHVPIPAADAMFDHVVVSQGEDRHPETLDVVVSVLPKMVIEEYIEAFSGTGIIPKSFEFESQAMARAVIRRGDNGSFLVADIGKMTTDVFVVANGVVQFSAALDIGGHHLTQAIVAAMHCGYDEAEALKIKHGLVVGEKEAGPGKAMLPVMLDLRTRLMRHYAYWQTHHGEKMGGSIEGVYLSGGGANLKGAEEYLSAELDVRVAVANPWINVCSFEEYIPPLTFRRAHGYTAAIGLALRDNFTS